MHFSRFDIRKLHLSDRVYFRIRSFPSSNLPLPPSIGQLVEGNDVTAKSTRDDAMTPWRLDGKTLIPTGWKRVEIINCTTSRENIINPEFLPRPYRQIFFVTNAKSAETSR